MSEARVLDPSSPPLHPELQPRPAQHALTTPLSDLDVARPGYFANDIHWPFFDRLRREAPVHYCKDSAFGPYWSVTNYRLIKEVDENHEVFSSEPGIVISDQDEDFQLPMFIAMDRPRHDEQRKVVQPVVAPRNLANLESTIRTRVGTILDNLPVGQSFNWVERVSIELTTQMLASILGFPFEERAKLTRWSDVATAAPGAGIVDSEEQRRAELLECLEYFTRLWNQRAGEPPADDMISMLVHGAATQNMPPMEYLGNVILLIVGGNDTTRNSISGGVLALNRFPGEYDKLRANPGLIPNMVAEIIRWQTPLAHMRRRARVDTILGGEHIRAGDKVVMWYVSGNRDETVFPDADRLIIDRENARKHLSFGFGIHRCMGNRLGEMQLRILWEEIMQRFRHVEVVGEPERVFSTFVRGYTSLPVIVHPR
jgi:cytochrome P450